MPDRLARPAPAPLDQDVTVDHLLGGRVALRQPRVGYRVAIDPVLLAAATPVCGGERVLDLGTGTGAAALCLATRVAGVRVTGLERDPAVAALAAANAATNRLADRVSVVTGDLLAPPPALPAGGFDRVIANPPFLDPARATVSPDPARAAATAESEAGLDDWVACAARMVRPRGWVTLIHRVDRLDTLVHLLCGNFGAITVFPLWPRHGRAARRVIVAARRGGRGPARLAAGLVLHRGDGGYTDAAAAVLEGGGALDLFGDRG